MRASIAMSMRSAAAAPDTLSAMAERSHELLRSIYRLRAGFVAPEHAAVVRACDMCPEVRAIGGVGWAIVVVTLASISCARWGHGKGLTPTNCQSSLSPNQLVAKLEKRFPEHPLTEVRLDKVRVGVRCVRRGVWRVARGA